MAVVAPIGHAEPDGFCRRDERETVIPRIPMHCILSRSRHVTLDAPRARAFRLVPRMFRHRGLVNCAKGPFPVTGEAERVRLR